MLDKRKKFWFYLLLIFLACEIIKYIEFIFIRTDETIIAENIICKLFCICAIIFFLYRTKQKWRDMGFKRNGIFKPVLFGLSLGIFTFTLSYLTEFIILSFQNKDPQFKFFISNFRLTGTDTQNLSLFAVLICIIGNIVNVTAEEGLFRGVFLNMGKKAYSFKTANLIQSVLFGIWHLVSVVLCLIDGTMNIPTAVVMSVGYIILAAILAYEWGLCTALTGTVWAGISEHFFNNFIGNSLHVVSSTGTDELQILRIVMSNILSLLCVIMITKIKKKKQSAVNG